MNQFQLAGRPVRNMRHLCVSHSTAQHSTVVVIHVIECEQYLPDFIKSICSSLFFVVLYLFLLFSLCFSLCFVVLCCLLFFVSLCFFVCLFVCLFSCRCYYYSQSSRISV
jgi:hypothetical protein